MSTIPHPAGNGRQQPNPDAYTIISAARANEAGTVLSVVTSEAGTMHVSQADAPALWQKVQTWAAQPGKSIAAYSAPMVVPRTVTRLQALLVLADQGLLAAVEAWVAQQSAAVQIRWANATEFDRDSEFIADAIDGLGMTEEQMDALFIAAGSIT